MIKLDKEDKLPELEWIMTNRHLLSDDDYTKLWGYNLFEQYENGDLYDAFECVNYVLGHIYRIYNELNSK